MKTTINTNLKTKAKAVITNGPLLLILGTLATILTHFRFGIGELAWIAPLPFMLFLHQTNGFKSRATFLAVLFLAWTLAILKICTSPVPYFLAPLFALPIALSKGLGYLLFFKLKARFKGVLSAVLFPSIMVVCDWLNHTLTPFASWGSMAYTQLDNQSLLQVASVTGMEGISFIVYLAAALCFLIISDKSASKNSTMHGYGLLLGYGFLVVAVIVFGTIRLQMSDSSSKEAILVAAIGTDSTIGGPDVPSE